MSTEIIPEERCTYESKPAYSGSDSKVLNSVPSMTESLSNRVEVRNIRGKNRAVDMVYSSPFRIFQLGQDSPGDPVELMFSTYGGGMLQGDRVRLDLRCGAGSSLRLQSQANSQVFRNENGKDSFFELQAHLEENSSVFISPEPVVLHKDARYHQIQRWYLERNAKLLLVDWMQSGRSDSGERFLFQKYLSELEIYRDSKILLKERFRCCPERDFPTGSAAFMGLDHMVTVFFIGYETLPEGLEEFRKKELLRIYPLEDKKPIEPPPLLMAEMELSGQAGWMVRLLGRSRLDLEPVLQRLLFLN